MDNKLLHTIQKILDITIILFITLWPLIFLFVFSMGPEGMDPPYYTILSCIGLSLFLLPILIILNMIVSYKLNSILRIQILTFIGLGLITLDAIMYFDWIIPTIFGLPIFILGIALIILSKKNKI